MSKPLYAKAGLFAIIVVSLFLTTCQSLKSVFQEPLVTLHSVELKGINFTGAEILCKVNVENRNPIDIPFPEIDWELFINTNSFVKGKLKSNSAIKARRTTTVDIPVSLKYLDVFNTFSSLKSAQKANYKVALDTKFNLPVIGDKVWHFEHAGELPVLHLPSVSFRGISLKNLSLTRVDFELSWEIENPNSFAMNIKDSSYNFAVNGSQWSSGKLASTQIGVNRKTVVPLNFSINNLSVVKDITEIVTNGDDINYVCTGNLILGSAMPGLEDFRTPLNFSGRTKLRN